MMFMLRSGVEEAEAKKCQGGLRFGAARDVSLCAAMIARRTQRDQGFRGRCRFDRTPAREKGRYRPVSQSVA
jgi:hypothetical protein